MKMRFSSGLMVAVGLFHLSVSAAEPVANATDSTSVMLLQTLFGLVVVILTILLLAWVAKKLNVQTGGKLHGFNLLAVMPLGSREKAVLIEVAGQKMLIGVAPGRVNTLHVFDSNEMAKLCDKQEQKPSQSQSKMLSPLALSARTTSEFSRKLHSFLGQGIRRP